MVCGLDRPVLGLFHHIVGVVISQKGERREARVGRRRREDQGDCEV